MLGACTAISVFGGSLEIHEFKFDYLVLAYQTSSPDFPVNLPPAKA